MKIKDLVDKLKVSNLFGAYAGGEFDDNRSVIVQVYEGEYDFGDGGPTISRYKYYDVRAVGTLFHEGEFKQVIAVGEPNE